MTAYEIISTVIAGIGAIVAILSFVFSLITKRKCERIIEAHLEINENHGVAVGVNNGDMNVKQK